MVYTASLRTGKFLVVISCTSTGTRCHIRGWAETDLVEKTYIYVVGGERVNDYHYCGDDYHNYVVITINTVMITTITMIPR